MINVNKTPHDFDISYEIDPCTYLENLLSQNLCHEINSSKNDFKNFKIEKLLGTGKFSKVYKCKRKNNDNDNKTYAIKIINLKRYVAKSLFINSWYGNQNFTYM